MDPAISVEIDRLIFRGCALEATQVDRLCRLIEVQLADLRGHLGGTRDFEHAEVEASTSLVVGADFDVEQLAVTLASAIRRQFGTSILR